MAALVLGVMMMHLECLTQKENNENQVVFILVVLETASGWFQSLGSDEDDPPEPNMIPALR